MDARVAKAQRPTTERAAGIAFSPAERKTKPAGDDASLLSDREERAL